jgi:hypothetical protein
MFAKLGSAVLAVAIVVSVAAAQPAPKPVDDTKLVTKVYNVKPLLGERGKAAGLADADAVVKLVFQAIPQLRDLKPGADGPQIVERDGGKFEVRATAKRHEEVKDLLDALARLQDVAIDVQADVIELSPAEYAKLLKILPKWQAKLPVVFATGAEDEGLKPDAPERKSLEAASKILKAGRVVQTSSGRFVNGAEATVSARRTVVTFSNVPNPVRVGGKSDEPLFVKEGFSLVALPVVSGDRRFVRFRLTEQSTVISGVKTRDLGEIGGKKIVMKSLETEDLGATGSAVVADGGTAVFKLAYAPKDRVWVAVLKPRIFIQAEEDELQRQRRLEDKVKRVFPDKPKKPGS